MHAIRHDVIEQALIMRDDEHRARGRAQRIDAFGDQFQRVDIQTGIGFIEDRELGLEQRHLQDFQSLFFAAGKANIQRTLQHFFRNFKRGGFRAHGFKNRHRIDIRFRRAHGVAH